MNLMNYLFIGVVLMFCIEYSLNTKYVKGKLTSIPTIGGTERIIGILLWPVCLGIFLYSFFKEFFK